MTEEEFKQWFEDKMYDIIIGGQVFCGKWLLSMQPPEPAKIPEVLSRQLVRQRYRLEVKGRVL